MMGKFDTEDIRTRFVDSFNSGREDREQDFNEWLAADRLNIIQGLVDELGERYSDKTDEITLEESFLVLFVEEYLDRVKAGYVPEQKD